MGRPNPLEGRLKSPENSVEGVRWNDINRLQCNLRVNVCEEACCFVDGVIGGAC